MEEVKDFKIHIFPKGKAACAIAWLTLLGTILFMGGRDHASADMFLGSSSSSKEIEFGYPDQTVFVTTKDDQGRLCNPMINLGMELLNKAGLSWHTRAYPAKRLFENLKSGVTQFSLLVRVPALEDSCIYSKQPIYQTTLNVYWIGNKPEITSREDLKGKKLIIILGYSYGGLLPFIKDPANKINNFDTRRHESAFQMLEANRGDYLLDYATASDHVLERSPIKDIRYHPIDTLDIYIVLSRTYPDAGQMMKTLEDIAVGLDVENL